MLNNEHHASWPSNVRSFFNMPEFNVVIFGFLLSLPWEMLQVPFYAGMMTAPHWPAVEFCTLAAIVDAFIMLMAYWGVAFIAQSRRWVSAPTRSQVLVFLALGLAVTLSIEHIATHAPCGWRYSPLMPVEPLLGIALEPVLMWVIVPLLLLWFVKRQQRPPAEKELP